MDTRFRPHFNAAYNDALYQRVMNRLTEQLGRFEFRVAETPLLLSQGLREGLARNAEEIVGQLSQPLLLERLKHAIPERYRAPGMDALPNCVQVDFALTATPDGGLEGKVVELQAFPSLYALMSFMNDAWAESFESIEGLRADWTCFLGLERKAAMDLMARTIIGAEDPREVVLVDLEPPRQKTSPDFYATQRLFGVDPVCVTALKKEGNRLYREVDGQRVRVKRIYNRMVFDELEKRGVQPPFDWRDELDLSWCSHPNWYWVWSKFSLPFIEHPAVPRARFLSSLQEVPQDLHNYVLKPLFSFAGSGVVVDVTPEDIARVPAEQRDGWVLQEKIEYAPAVRMPDGNGVKAEVRVMLLRPPDADRLVPLLCLVRLSRGKMLGVDQNKNFTWVGGSVGMWAR